jgi:hypothetical protein
MSACRIRNQITRSPGHPRGGITSARRSDFTIPYGGIALVVVWWLAIAAAVIAVMPAPVSSAQNAGLVVTSGRVARIKQPGMPTWRIPVERAAFEEINRALHESDEETFERAMNATAWITVSHGRAVRVLFAEGDAVQIALLDGDDAGDRAWVRKRHLME